MTTYDQWKSTNPADESLGPEPQHEGPTEHEILRLVNMLSAMAGEQVSVRDIKGTIYAFGSELACLRLAYRYNSPKCRAGYSENMKTWYFSIEQERST